MYNAEIYESVEDFINATLKAGTQVYGIRFPHEYVITAAAYNLALKGLLALRIGAFILIITGPDAWKHIEKTFTPYELATGWEDGDGRGPSVGDTLAECLEAVIRRIGPPAPNTGG
jgi:hypothetical protein